MKSLAPDERRPFPAGSRATAAAAPVLAIFGVMLLTGVLWLPLFIALWVLIYPLSADGGEG
jgi:hypothetical protein